MKLTDYVADFLVKEGIKHVFGLTGGAAVHLFDSLDRHPGIQPIFTHHEQAAALAAEAYAHAGNGLGAAFVTTGPGGTNAITGVTAAWLDSIPTVYISGQSRMDHTSRGKGIRQVGTQELDIVSLVSHITKYAVMVEDSKTIRYHLEKAVYLARSGRPGPVWIDVPLNFQWEEIEPDELPGFEPEEAAVDTQAPPVGPRVRECLELMAQAKRPLILAGYGIRLAHAEKEFRQLVETLKLPFIASWNASDMVPTDDELYIGRPGIAGQRGANLAVQNCDLLLCIGSHLSVALTGTMFDAFARDAKVIMVDVDKAELDFRTVRVDIPVQCDARVFLQEMLRQAGARKAADIGWWRQKCSDYKSKYNIIPREWKDQKEYVNPYVFVDALSDELEDSDTVVVDGGGTVVYTSFQAFRVREGQRLIISSGICAMGTGLPESVGACFARGGGRTICLIGDGSMQLNIHELQTIVHHQLPIKIFVFNNDGYLAIRHTQDGFLESNYVGSDKSGGLSLPDYVRVAEAYGIKADRAHNHEEMKEKILWALNEPGPVLCEIMISRDQQMVPRQGFRKRRDGTFAPAPLEDMHPMMDREEFKKNMVIEPWTE